MISKHCCLCAGEKSRAQRVGTMVGMANGRHLHGRSHPSDLAQRKPFLANLDTSFIISLLFVYDIEGLI